jgi:acylphosphatase
MVSAIRRVTIRGRVQGVGYRAFVTQQARALGLEGWVRNCRDGSVEVLVAGPASVVADMIEQCRRGPAYARVEAVQEESAGSDTLNLRRAGEGFSVLGTL